MPDIRFLIPHPERLVRDPLSGRALNPSGELINLADPKRRTFYLRRLRDGDVTQGRPPVPKASKAPDSKEE